MYTSKQHQVSRRHVFSNVISQIILGSSGEIGIRGTIQFPAEHLVLCPTTFFFLVCVPQFQRITFSLRFDISKMYVTEISEINVKFVGT